MSDIIPEGILYGNLGVGSGTTNYNALDNKPQINSVTLKGNKTASELGLVGTSDIPVTSVNGETGAVVLDGTEINYQAGKTINQKIDEVEAEIPVVSYPVTSVNGETGAVVLDGTDIEYSSGVSVNSQIDTLMQYTPVYGNTASGAIATFDTSLALPLQDCTIAINAVQEGTGDPSPSNVRNLVGFTGANIKQFGANLISGDTYQLGGNVVLLGESADDTYSTYLKATTYTISFTRPTGKAFRLDLTDSNGVQTRLINAGTATSRTFTIATEGYYKFGTYLSGGMTSDDIANVMLVAGSEVKPYKAYTAPTTTAITWNSEAGTVYGGSLDVTSGVLTVTHAIYTFTGSETEYIQQTNRVAVGTTIQAKSSTAICTHFTSVQTGSTRFVYIPTTMTAADLRTFMTNNTVNLVYELVTPTTYQLTPTQVSAIVGTNNVFTDTNGDTSVVYACSLKDYIDSQ